MRESATDWLNPAETLGKSSLLPGTPRARLGCMTGPMRVVVVCALGLSLATPGAAAPHPVSALPTVTIQDGQPQAPPLVRIASDLRVYAEPHVTRIPLRMATRGRLVRVLEQQGEWTRIEFDTPVSGRFDGWVHGFSTELPEEDLGRVLLGGAPRFIDRQWAHVELARSWVAELGTEVQQNIPLYQGRKLIRLPYARLEQRMGVAGAAGVTLRGNLGVAARVAIVSRERPVDSVSVAVPNPVPAGPVAYTSAQGPTLMRRDVNLDMSGVYTWSTPNVVRIRLVAGPTLCRVTQEVVSDATYSQVASATSNVVRITGVETARVTTTVPGFHAGLDLAFFPSRHLGAGITLRYARAVGTFEEPLDHVRVDVQPDSPGVALGLRLRF